MNPTPIAAHPPTNRPTIGLDALLYRRPSLVLRVFPMAVLHELSRWAA